MRHSTIFLGSVMLSLSVSAQKAPANTTEKAPGDIMDITRATFLMPGVSYEKRIARFQSLVVKGFFELGSTSRRAGNNVDLDLFPAPGLSVQYRYYYNYSKRAAAGRRTDYNNLNFVSPLYQVVWSKIPFGEYAVAEPKARPIHNVGAVWGIQRNYPGRFSLELSLGLGYYFTTETYTVYNPLPPSYTTFKRAIGGVTGISQFSLGIWLNKRKPKS